MGKRLFSIDDVELERFGRAKAQLIFLAVITIAASVGVGITLVWPVGGYSLWQFVSVWILGVCAGYVVVGLLQIRRMEKWVSSLRLSGLADADGETGKDQGNAGDAVIREDIVAGVSVIDIVDKDETGSGEH